jgi:hypothetical protein
VSLLEDEPSPQEAQLQMKYAWYAVGLAVCGWGFLLLTLMPYSTFHQGSARATIIFFAYALFLGSFLPAIVGLALAMGALRLRGDHRTVALCALVASGLHMGLAIGLIVLNLWHN